MCAKNFKLFNCPQKLFNFRGRKVFSSNKTHYEALVCKATIMYSIREMFLKFVFSVDESASCELSHKQSGNG